MATELGSRALGDMLVENSGIGQGAIRKRGMAAVPRVVPDAPDYMGEMVTLKADKNPNVYLVVDWSLKVKGELLIHQEYPGMGPNKGWWTIHPTGIKEVVT